jgi:predicted nucleotidyltransferase
MSLFGSALRDELKPSSDIDILVEFDKDHMPGLFDISRMEIELSETIGRKVDLRTPEDLSRYFRDEVVKNAEVHYEEAR